MTELENGITKLGCVNHDCEKCKAKVEQEPVAWVIECEEYNSAGERPVLREIDYYSHIVDQLPAGTKLYTTPPQRTWVGLTWEEIDECFKITPDQYLPAQIYKRIEAKLKEKNT